MEAQERVNGLTSSWYFLHMELERLDRHPWIAYQDERRTLVSIAGNVDDYFWRTIDTARTDSEFVGEIADRLLTVEGRAGRIVEILDAGGWPVLVTHWQSLFSNGLETGLAALDEVGRRIEEHLSKRVEWKRCSEITQLVRSVISA
jgi:hypothetical protein